MTLPDGLVNKWKSEISCLKCKILNPEISHPCRSRRSRGGKSLRRMCRLLVLLLFLLCHSLYCLVNGILFVIYSLVDNVSKNDNQGTYRVIHVTKHVLACLVFPNEDCSVFFTDIIKFRTRAYDFFYYYYRYRFAHNRSFDLFVLLYRIYPWYSDTSTPYQTLSKISSGSTLFAQACLTCIQ